MGHGGGGSKSQTVGYRYYLGMHLVFCAGPVDAIIQMRVSDKVAWQGYRTEGAIQISASDLFGGDSREGGVSGTIDIEFGGPTQIKNDYLQGQLGSNIPAFRGVVSAIFRRVYLGLNPYLKKWSMTFQRLHVRQNGLPQWYDSKVAVPASDTDKNGYLEDFTQGLDIYTLTQGSNKNDFSIVNTPFGLGMKTTSTTGGCFISRNVESTKPKTVSFKFQINSIGNDDAGRIYFLDQNGSTILELDTARASIDDSLRRATVNPPYGGQGIPLSSAQLNTNTWYDCIAEFDWTNATLDIYLELYGTQLGHVQIGLNTSLYIAQLQFVTDTQTSGVGSSTFSNIKVDGTYILADMNPVHIIRECLTDPSWGLGYLESSIDDTNFKAAADTLYNEGFGLSLLWENSQKIEDFIIEIAKHIDGVPRVNRTTGLFELKLIRNDYNKASLISLDESNISKVENVTTPAFGELVNSVTVNYWDGPNNVEASTSQQNIALEAIQGATINTTRAYPGITKKDLAEKVCARDLKALSSPLLSASFYVNPTAMSLNVGDPFLFSWADYSISNKVMRVTNITFPDTETNQIKIECVEDVFDLPTVVQNKSNSVGWTDPNVDPEVATERFVQEAFYYELVERLGQATLDSNLSSNPDLSYMMATAGRKQSAAVNAQLAIDSGSGMQIVGTMDFSPAGVLANELVKDYTQTTVTLSSVTDSDKIETGTWAYLNDELLAVVSYDSQTQTVEVVRALLDTIPQDHGAGSVIYFADLYASSDGVEYVQGDQLQVEILPTTGKGTLNSASAPADTITLQGRAIRPLRPGNLTAGTTKVDDLVNIYAYPVTVSWSSRNRKTQTTKQWVKWDDGDVTPETGTTYEIDIETLDSNLNSNGVVHTITQSTQTFDLTSAMLGAQSSDPFVRINVYSVRDSYKSFMPAQIIIRGSFQAVTNLTEDYLAPVAPTNLSGTATN